MQRPRLSPDLVARPRLITRLNQGLDRKLTVISAQAGAGKTTLLAQWLEDCPQPSAWLSLDEHDNDLMVFVSYLCAAIQTVFPNACGEALELMKAIKAPPPRIITIALVNELEALHRGDEPLNQDHHSKTGFILALDDYYTITEPTIHQFLSELIVYLPQGLHLALASRIDPPFPLARLRTRYEMTEVRTADLRLSSAETGSLLTFASGRELSKETIELFEKKTDGWAAGLRLAALSIRDLSDVTLFAQRFQEISNPVIMDYLLSEVLSQQSPAYWEFLLQTSILERFNGELCDAILWQAGNTTPASADLKYRSSRSILIELDATNLFLISLDQQAEWYRYHHLFRDLLLHRLRQQHSPEHIAALHKLASRWFEENGFIEEALTHAFLARDMDHAAAIVSRHRYGLMNRARWRRLDQYLHLFPPEYVDHTPGLLMLKAWLLYHHGHYSQLPPTLAKLEATLGLEALSPQAISHLKGEMSALCSLLYYFGSG